MLKFCKFMLNKSNVTRFFLVVGYLVAVTGCTRLDTQYTTSSPYSTLSQKQVEQWKVDLDYLVEQLEARHINFYHSVDESQVRAGIVQIKAQLATMTQSSLKVALMTLINQMGDGHTMSGWWGSDYRRFPISLKWFGDDLLITATSKEYAHVLGTKLIAINDIPISKIVSTISKIAPTAAENMHASKEAVTWTINVADVLFGLGIVDQYEKANFTFEDSFGEAFTDSIAAISHQDFKQSLDVSMTPLKPVFGDAVESTDGIELYVDPLNSIAYIDFDYYPSYWDMLWFGPNVIQQLEDNQIENVIIDLRDNGGGNFFIGLFLAQELVVVDNIDWQDGVYVLVNNATFSAASSNAVQFRQILNAKIIGEPSGGNPHGYQDSDTFYLPNSGWPISYSKRLFRFQEAKTEGVQPDFLVPLNWLDFKEGKDSQINWILSEIATKTSIKR
jgi:hypothetical protein